jgi:hypothetical protein
VTHDIAAIIAETREMHDSEKDARMRMCVRGRAFKVFGGGER